MKKIIAAALVLVSSSAFAGGFHHAPSNESWTGGDKTKHFAVSAALGAGSYALTEETEHPFLYAVGLAMVPGVAKEVYDARSGGTGFSHKDLAADLLGAVVGASIGNAIVSFNGENVSLSYTGHF